MIPTFCWEFACEIDSAISVCRTCTKNKLLGQRNTCRKRGGGVGEVNTKVKKRCYATEGRMVIRDWDEWYALLTSSIYTLTCMSNLFWKKGVDPIYLMQINWNMKIGLRTREKIWGPKVKKFLRGVWTFTFFQFLLGWKLTLWRQGASIPAFCSYFKN